MRTKLYVCLQKKKKKEKTKEKTKKKKEWKKNIIEMWEDLDKTVGELVAGKKIMNKICKSEE